MNVVNLALQAAGLKMWQYRQEMGGGLRLEVPTQPGRTQVVNVTPGRDPDGDLVTVIWSRAGDLAAARDPMGLLTLSGQLVYGKVAVRGNDVIVTHALLDEGATLREVGKSIVFVARTADQIEQGTYGAYSDTL